MRLALFLHIVAGALGLGAGYVALAAAKGGRLHRRSGAVFVWGMVVLGLTGAGIAAATSVEVSVVAGLTAAYLVVTALTTVRPRTPFTRRIDRVAMVVGLANGFAAAGMGTTLLVTGQTWDGMPAFPFFVVGLPALLGGLGDIRVLRLDGLVGVARLTRHLWRMSYALLIAALSFFLGQVQVIPEVLRHPALLAAPVLVVLAVMLYWLRLVRIRRSLRELVGIRAPEAI